MEGYFLNIANKLDAKRLGAPPGKFDYLRELKTWDLWRAVLAEFLATMLFVFIGCMSATTLPLNTGKSEYDFAVTFIRVGFTFGLMIAVLIQMIGHVSGGHINPAVSIAMALAMKISPARAVLYIIGQCVGGVIGGFILKGVTPDAIHNNLGVTSLAADLDAGQGFGVETILTFILVFSIFGITDSDRPFFGSPALGIGLTISTMHFAGMQYTGSSMNPARSLASAVVSNSWDDHWVYWVGPILGGVLASLLYTFIFNPYRGKMSQGEAISQLMIFINGMANRADPDQTVRMHRVIGIYTVSDGDMVLIPKSYFNENPEIKNKGDNANINMAQM